MERLKLWHVSSMDDVPQSKLDEIISSLSKEEPAKIAKALRTWESFARPEQLPPPQPWQVWMFLAGRGAGKTRSGSEWIRENVRQGVKRIGLIAPTAGDSRDVMVEDSSGILEVCWEYDRDIKGNPLYEPAPSFQGRRAVSVSERVWWPHQCPHRRTDRAERGFGLEALGSAFRCTRCAPSGGRFFRDDYARAEPRFIRPQSLTAKLEVE
jgi:hypothetical protein